MAFIVGVTLACSNKINESDGIEPSTGFPIDTTSMRVTKYGKTWVYYAEVDKAGDYSRRMLLEESAARAMIQNGRLPDGALVAMETWFGRSLGTVYLRQKSEGRVYSGSFSPSTPVFDTRNDISCNGCHNRAASTEDFFTLPLLQKALQRNRVQRIVCDQPSFTPCNISVYQGD